MPHTADFQEIKKGQVTDIYFSRAIEILKAKRIHKRVKAEFIVKKMPADWRWGILAGIEECGELLSGLPVSVRSIPEGHVFYPYEPVMEIEGFYEEFGEYETALLGLICQASGIATKSARCKQLAGERSIISFGARRMHPAIAPMIERSAYIGGCDGVSVVKSAELIGEEPTGTMPHALILVMGSTVKALKAFDDVISRRVRRVALVDTFGDEKFEALDAARALGKRLYAVRLDTPGSRRGNFPRILQEVRWELDLRGFKDVKLVVSGGIDEEQIPLLNRYVDSYGIGAAISNAPVIDFAMDIIEIDGKPVAKRGKMSGSKRVYRCKTCLASEVSSFRQRKKICTRKRGTGSPAECKGALEEILGYFMKKGKLLHKGPGPKEIRGFVLRQLHQMSELGSRLDLSG